MILRRPSLTEFCATGDKLCRRTALLAEPLEFSTKGFEQDEGGNREELVCPQGLIGSRATSLHQVCATLPQQQSSLLPTNLFDACRETTSLNAVGKKASPLNPHVIPPVAAPAPPDVGGAFKGGRCTPPSRRTEDWLLRLSFPGSFKRQAQRGVGLPLVWSYGTSLWGEM